MGCHTISSNTEYMRYLSRLDWNGERIFSKCSPAPRLAQHDHRFEFRNLLCWWMLYTGQQTMLLPLMTLLFHKYLVCGMACSSLLISNPLILYAFSSLLFSLSFIPL